MRVRYDASVRLNADSLALVEACNGIVSEYVEMGIRITLRQLYYRLVAAGRIANTEKSYRRVGRVVGKARMAGLMDWDAIEDRARRPQVPPEWDSAGEIVRVAMAQFRLPRRATQPIHVELWVEKDAISSVLAPVARETHVTLMVNRGYSSLSAMRECAVRIAEEAADRRTVILYLGDHDPSGEDMVRDVSARLRTFGARCEVRKIALTMEQVEQYDPPPNPAKMTDSRAAAYVARHGEYSWEVDALPPDVMVEIVRSEIADLTDQALVDAVVSDERRQRAVVERALRTGGFS